MASFSEGILSGPGRNELEGAHPLTEAEVVKVEEAALQPCPLLHRQSAQLRKSCLLNNPTQI